MDFLDSRKSQRLIIDFSRPIKSGAYKLYNKGLFEELGWFTQLFLIDDHLHLVAETSERNATEIAILIEMIDSALVNTMLIYSGHDPKDGPLVEAPYLVFVLKAGGVEGGPPQLSYAKLSLISGVTTTADNDEIKGISQSGDVVFLKLDLLSTVVETEIGVRASLQH
jgi:hypothetical protein